MKMMVGHIRYNYININRENFYLLTQTIVSNQWARLPNIPPPLISVIILEHL